MIPEAARKPLLGLSSKRWRIGIYSVAGLVVFLSAALGAGLLHPGTLVTVVTSPPGAEITWAGKVRGVTPFTAFFEQGKAPLVLTKPGHTTQSQVFSSGNNLLFSWIWPRTETVDKVLTPLSPDSLWQLLAEQTGQWELSAPFDNGHAFPPLFSEYRNEGAQAHLLALRGHIADPAMYADYGRALGLWPLTPPEGLETQTALWETFLKGVGAPADERLVFWVLANQNAVVRSTLVASGSPELVSRREAWQASVLTLPETGESRAGAPIKTALGVFRGVAGGWTFWGQTKERAGIPSEAPYHLPVPLLVEPFWIAENPVTKAQFQEFSSSPQVTWDQAQAYVSWLNTQTKAPTGLRWALANEVEWETALRQVPSLLTFGTGRWEWTSSVWQVAGPLSRTTAADAPDQQHGYARTIKGGRDVWDRAGVPANESSEVISFRLILVSTAREATP